MAKKPIADPSFTAAIDAAILVKNNIDLVVDSVRALEESVQQRIKNNTQILEAHLSDPDLRPKFVHTVAKSVHTIALNDQIYRFGPRENLDDLEDDDDKFFWTDPNNLTHYAPSMTTALIHCINHFCTRGVE